ncbi:MAG: DEAD/DEAH box helicase family protein, partial [Candidatus Neomarinimicrobiota bacterium]
WTGRSNDYQKLVIETVMDNYFSQVRGKRGISGVVLNLPTGHGKTFVAMAIMDILKLPTLIVCPRIKVANQWYDLLSKLFPNIQVGVFHSMRKIDGDIVVGVIDSFVSCNHFILKDDDSKGRNVVKNTYDVKEFYKRWGLIVFDECHNYSTKVNSTIFRRMEAQYTLGLSATPNKGNFSVISQWNIGPILDPENIDDYIETYKREKTVPVFKGKIVGVKYHGPKEYTKNIVNKNNHIIPYKMLDQLMSDPYRLALINKKITELCNKDYCTLIFSDRISYLRQIQESLKDNENSIILDDIKDIHQVITGGATDAEMARAYKSSKIILTTYAFFMEGISIPRINAIIYATPRKSGIKQANGRCIRPSTAKNIKRRNKENNKERIIIDIIDWNISLKSQWYVRKKTYSSMDEIGAEFDIFMEEINYDEILTQC